MRCEISREALDDHFDGDGKDNVTAFRANKPAIERALAAYKDFLTLWKGADPTSPS